MRQGILGLILCVFGITLMVGAPTPTKAQTETCEAFVYFGAPGGVQGQDSGDCSTAERACASWEYALEQGKQACSQAVYVTYIDQNKSFRAVTWQPPSEPDQEQRAFIQMILPWIGAAVGLVIGWLAASIVQRTIQHRKGGAS